MEVDEMETNLKLKKGEMKLKKDRFLDLKRKIDDLDHEFEDRRKLVKERKKVQSLFGRRTREYQIEKERNTSHELFCDNILRNGKLCRNLAVFLLSEKAYCRRCHNKLNPNPNVGVLMHFG